MIQIRSRSVQQLEIYEFVLKPSGWGENGDFRASERSVYEIREHRSAEKSHLQARAPRVQLDAQRTL